MSLAIITGASSGIGREFARALTQKYGVDELWLIARREDRMNELLASLSSKGVVIGADLTTTEGIERVKGVLAEKKPSVKYLINCAGFGKFGDYSQISDSDVASMIDLNVKALVLMTNAVIPYMERDSRIIELASASAFAALPHLNVYAATKAFVLSYTRGLSYEIAEKGIYVTAVCPCFVKTEFISVAERDDVRMPKKIWPLLSVEKVVRGALRASKKKKKLYTTNWYTKLMHLVSKICPSSFASRVWLSMLRK